ncbi:hypothetical protein BRD00_12930 [Halobacteriales archaeon QS_8_69_26]|nr:MAG: hypothetical protein BRD00_12930 [Halobacteriales archaeon QS_8_69_26]
MSVVTALRSLRSAARKAVARIRRHLPGKLGRRRWSGGRDVPDENSGELTRRPPATPGSLTRQSAMRRSSTALEDPARFGDPDDHGDGETDRGNRPGRLAADPDPLNGLAPRDRPLSEPADDDPNDTKTEGDRRGDGRVRIADPGDSDAYVESDVSVALDHLR